MWCWELNRGSLQVLKVLSEPESSPSPLHTNLIEEFCTLCLVTRAFLLTVFLREISSLLLPSQTEPVDCLNYRHFCTGPGLTSVQGSTEGTLLQSVRGTRLNAGHTGETETRSPRTPFFFSFFKFYGLTQPSKMYVIQNFQFRAAVGCREMALHRTHLPLSVTL